jgi:glycosyltransferase involved in cell wall biosynthesis
MFSSAHISILPFEDGLSERRTSFMTAMAFGVPFVTSLPKFPIEGLINGHNIVYLKGNTVDEIRKTLLSLCSMGDGKLQQLGLNARQWYEANFSEDILFQKLSAIVGC